MTGVARFGPFDDRADILPEGTRVRFKIGDKPATGRILKYHGGPKGSRLCEIDPDDKPPKESPFKGGASIRPTVMRLQEEFEVITNGARSGNGNGRKG